MSQHKLNHENNHENNRELQPLDKSNTAAPSVHQYDAILFDLDGTLLNTAPDLVTAVNALRQELQGQALPDAEILAMVGRGAKNLIQKALHDIKHPLNDDQTYLRFAHHYHQSNGQKSEPYPGVQDLLKKLQQLPIKMGIVTNKPTEFTSPLVKQFGWDAYFDVTVCGDTLPQKKPSPEPILWACQQLQVSPNKTLMIGDSMNDVLAAIAAMASCVALSYGYNEGIPIAKALAAYPQIPLFEQFSGIVSFD